MYYYASHPFLWPLLRGRLLPCFVISLFVYTTLFMFFYLPQVAFFAIFREQKLKPRCSPISGPEDAISLPRKLRRKTHQKNIPASGVLHSASPLRCRRIARSNTSRFSR